MLLSSPGHNEFDADHPFNIAQDLLELRFVFLFASISIFLFNLALVYSVSDVSHSHGLSFGTLRPFDPVVHSGFLTSLTATV